MQKVAPLAEITIPIKLEANIIVGKTNYRLAMELKLAEVPAGTKCVTCGKIIQGRPAGSNQWKGHRIAKVMITKIENIDGMFDVRPESEEGKDVIKAATRKLDGSVYKTEMCFECFPGKIDELLK